MGIVSVRTLRPKRTWQWTTFSLDSISMVLVRRTWLLSATRFALSSLRSRSCAARTFPCLEQAREQVRRFTWRRQRRSSSRANLRPIAVLVHFVILRLRQLRGSITTAWWPTACCFRVPRRRLEPPSSWSVSQRVAGDLRWTTEQPMTCWRSSTTHCRTFRIAWMHWVSPLTSPLST